LIIHSDESYLMCVSKCVWSRNFTQRGGLGPIQAVNVIEIKKNVIHSFLQNRHKICNLVAILQVGSFRHPSPSPDTPIKLLLITYIWSTYLIHSRRIWPLSYLFTTSSFGTLASYCYYLFLLFHTTNFV